MLPAVTMLRQPRTKFPGRLELRCGSIRWVGKSDAATFRDSQFGRAADDDPDSNPPFLAAWL
jgi:hypothetical protein